MLSESTKPTVLLAGRRPDPEGAETRRFPVENVLIVRERIRTVLVERGPGNLICSAACGADLLALDVAGDLGIKRHIVLPFDVNTFRETSVTDRPGHWGPLYDRVVREVQSEGGLTILGEEPGDEAAYVAANDALLETAKSIGARLLVVTVWEGGTRGDGDLTVHLAQAASKAGAETASVSTTWFRV